MFKLIKYEFRKNRTLMAIILAVVAALEIYFLASTGLRSETNMLVSASIMLFSFFLVALAVFIMGIASYSRELGQKSSYLIFMTPNGTLSIVVSKLLFTLFIGLLFAALMAALLVVNFPMLMDAFGQEWRGFYALLDMVMQQSGMGLTSILLSILFFALLVFLQLLSAVSVAYLAITLSATFLQSKKGKGLVSAALFAAITYGLARLSGLYVDDTATFNTIGEMTSALTPTLLHNAAVVLVGLFGSAWMLDRRVSL